MEPNVFLPVRKKGLILHISAATVLVTSGGAAFWFALQQQAGSSFLFLLAVSIALLAPLTIVVYRGYALLKASYSLERNGLHLVWGLRSEDIPLADVEWVRPADELGFHLPVPALSWPGAILGMRTVEGLGVVEFMASDAGNLLLITTPDKIYVISPDDPLAFMGAIQRTMELGSLTPIRHQSARPAAYLQSVWSDRLARIFILTGLGLSLALFVLVTLLISGRDAISLGYDIYGQPVEPGPAESLLLLPVLCGFTFTADLIAGLFFYRWEDQQQVAYTLFASTILTPLLLIIAALLMI